MAARFPGAPLFAIGWSLGANILVNYLGEQGKQAAAAACSARAARTRYPVLATPAALAIWSLMLMLIIVYLRPISQFIYFQF